MAQMLSARTRESVILGAEKTENVDDLVKHSNQRFVSNGQTGLYQTQPKYPTRDCKETLKLFNPVYIYACIYVCMQVHICVHKCIVWMCLHVCTRLPVIPHNAKGHHVTQSY